MESCGEAVGGYGEAMKVMERLWWSMREPLGVMVPAGLPWGAPQPHLSSCGGKESTDRTVTKAGRSNDPVK